MKMEFLSVLIKSLYFYSLVKEQGSSARVSVVNAWSVENVYVWACCTESHDRMQTFVCEWSIRVTKAWIWRVSGERCESYLKI